MLSYSAAISAPIENAIYPNETMKHSSRTVTWMLSVELSRNITSGIICTAVGNLRGRVRHCYSQRRLSRDSEFGFPKRTDQQGDVQVWRVLKTCFSARLIAFANEFIITWTRKPVPRGKYGFVRCIPMFKVQCSFIEFFTIAQSPQINHFQTQLTFHRKTSTSVLKRASGPSSNFVTASTSSPWVSLRLYPWFSVSFGSLGVSYFEKNLHLRVPARLDGSY